MKIFLDTNILISGIFFRGNEAKLLRITEVEFITSQTVVEELKHIVKIKFRSLKVESFKLAIEEVDKAIKDIHIVQDVSYDKYIEEAKGRIEGECIFIRALVNFEMMRYFQNLKTGDAIPLLTSPTTIDDKPSRASVDGVCNQVIADLQRAIELLPVSNNDRATKWAAKALLSRVYFYRGNYQEAANAATEVIESNQFQLVTDSVIKNYRTELSDEIIFAIMSTVGDASCGALNGFFRKVSASAPKFILSDKLVKIFLFTSGYTDTIADKRYNEMNNEDNILYLKNN